MNLMKCHPLRLDPCPQYCQHMVQEQLGDAQQAQWRQPHYVQIPTPFGIAVRSSTALYIHCSIDSLRAGGAAAAVGPGPHHQVALSANKAACPLEVLQVSAY